MSGIFISYRQEDAKPWALLIRNELADALGDAQVFLDRDTLHAGSWRTQIHEALDQCKVVLVLIGRHWLTVRDESGVRRLDRSDDVHRQEIALALSHKEVTVIPILVDGVRMPRAADLPVEIRSLADQQSREVSDNSARRAVDIQALINDIARLTGLKAGRTKTGSLRKRLRVFDGGGWAVLKTSSALILAITVLTLSIWIFFYILAPATPLTPGETIIVLLISTGLVLAAKRVWVRLRRAKEGQ